MKVGYARVSTKNQTLEPFAKLSKVDDFIPQKG